MPDDEREDLELRPEEDDVEPTPRTTCLVAECFAAPARAGLCWGHIKRLQRGQPVNGPLAERPSSPSERLGNAALTYAHAGDDHAAFVRAQDVLRKAAIRYALDLLERVHTRGTSPQEG